MTDFPLQLLQVCGSGKPLINISANVRRIGCQHNVIKIRIPSTESHCNHDVSGLRKGSNLFVPVIAFNCHEKTGDFEGTY